MVSADALSGFLQELVQDFRLPGAVLAFASGDAAPVVAAAGWADVEAQIPIQPNDRLLGASIGKSFVAALVVSLSQSGVVALDEPMARWVGERSWFASLPNAAQLTLRHLLSHSAGLQDHVYQPGYLENRTRPDDPDWIFPNDDKVALISGLEPLFPPGGGFRYTDTAYVVAGLVIEAATGRAYYDLLIETFLKPLNLSLTGPSNSRRLPGLVPGYMVEKDPFVRSGLPHKVMQEGVLLYNPGSEWTGGGLISNPQDLVRWARALYSGALLGEAAAREIVQPVYPQPLEMSWRRYGLGAMTFETELGLLYGHWGNMPGYSGIMVYAPQQQIAFSLQANCTAFETKRAQETIHRFLLTG